MCPAPTLGPPDPRRPRTGCPSSPGREGVCPELWLLFPFLSCLGCVGGRGLSCPSRWFLGFHSGLMGGRPGARGWETCGVLAGLFCSHTRGSSGTQSSGFSRPPVKLRERVPFLNAGSCCGEVRCQLDSPPRRQRPDCRPGCPCPPLAHAPVFQSCYGSLPRGAFSAISMGFEEEKREDTHFLTVFN